MTVVSGFLVALAIVATAASSVAIFGCFVWLICKQWDREDREEPEGTPQPKVKTIMHTTAEERTFE